LKNMFSLYHPGVLLLYAGSAILCAILTLHPAYIALSLLAGTVYAVYLKGFKRFVAGLWFRALLFLLVAAANPLFNHRGLTILFYLFENPVTLEALLHGLCSGAMLLAVLTWFDCFGILITNEKFLFLFGRILPTTALMLSMTMKLLPQTRYKALQLENAYKGLYGSKEEAGRIRLRRTIRMSAILMSWSLEDSIETTDSMKARGYGVARRSSFSNYWFGRGDLAAALTIGLLAAGNIAYIIVFHAAYSFFPRASFSIGGQDGAMLAAYGALLLYPLLLEGREACRWRP